MASRGRWSICTFSLAEDILVELIAYEAYCEQFFIYLRIVFLRLCHSSGRVMDRLSFLHQTAAQSSLTSICLDGDRLTHVIKT